MPVRGTHVRNKGLLSNEVVFIPDGTDYSARVLSDEALACVHRTTESLTKG